MKRDMDIVRDILRNVAESNGGVSASTLSSKARPAELIAYHFEIMDEAGLIHATIKRGFGGQYIAATADSLTWSGNDFLSSISNENVWTEVKRKIGKTLGDASITTVKTLAVKIATDLLV